MIGFLNRVEERPVHLVAVDDNLVLAGDVDDALQ
jgi:hypothetical protein